MRRADSFDDSNVSPARPTWCCHFLGATRLDRAALHSIFCSQAPGGGKRSRGHAGSISSSFVVITFATCTGPRTRSAKVGRLTSRTKREFGRLLNGRSDGGGGGWMDGWTIGRSDGVRCYCERKAGSAGQVPCPLRGSAPLLILRDRSATFFRVRGYTVRVMAGRLLGSPQLIQFTPLSVCPSPFSFLHPPSHPSPLPPPRFLAPREPVSVLSYLAWF